MARSGEFDVIRKFFAPLARKAPGALGLRDDAALLRVPVGCELVVTTDALIEGVHFLKDDPADLIARKALRVNLSDLAAKGARAEAYLLALCIPPWVDDSWLARFAQGLERDQEIFGASLIGGDTTATPGPLTISITALGTVAEGGMITRAGAKAGDLVFVSGTIGDAGAGLAIAKSENAVSATHAEALVARYRLPEPRMALGASLAGLANAALDVSDGLVADLGHIADVSSVRIVIEAARVPLSPGVKALWGDGQDAAARAAIAGDDYEIAFTAPVSAREAVIRAAGQAGVPVSEIGRVEAGAGVVLQGRDGQAIALKSMGFRHF